MRAGMKMYMLTNRGGSGDQNEMRNGMEMRRGGSGGRNEMGYGGSEMRRGGSGSRNEASMGYGSEMGYGRSEGGSGGRNEMRGEMGDMENRFRGGEGYGDNPGMTYGMEDNYAESRRRFPRRRDGTFAPRSEMGGMEDAESHYPYVPPVYEREGGSRMNMIGFERRDEMSNNYGMNAEHRRMNEMENRSGQMQMGRGMSEMKMTREMAEEWMMGLQNEDGTKGPHWSMDQAKQVMQQRGIQADAATFWAVLNMMYSDYCKVFKKHGVGDRVDFYADMAAAWLNDKDGPDPAKKTAAYYQYVVNQ